MLAPAMTAIIAAAAAALDLTGDLLTADAAPCDTGVLFLPEPIYHRYPDGHLSAVGAITWIPLTTGATRRRSWVIGAWAPLDNPEDPESVKLYEELAAQPRLRNDLGPYVLTDYALLPVAEPVPAPEHRSDDAVTEWRSAPDGRHVIADDTANMDVVCAIAYAFWRIQAQPLAVTATPPLDRATRRRAHRASITYDTRIVMLRRTSAATERGGDAAWHYRVRFYVRGHWRRLVDKHGQPYRVWINGYIKGPDGAPLLHGEKVAVLAR